MAVLYQSNESSSLGASHLYGFCSGEAGSFFNYVVLFSDLVSKVS